MDRQVGRYQKGERQVIGDRVVLNPRTRLCSLRDAEGNVLDTFRLSLEVCGCGYSFARAGVGYRGSDRLVLQEMRAAAHIGREAIRERPDPPEARFIAGKRVRRGHPGIPRLVHAQRPGGRHGSTTAEATVLKVKRNERRLSESGRARASHA